MKRNLLFKTVWFLAMGAFVLSACSDDDSEGKKTEVKQSKLKEVGVVYEGDGVETYEAEYDAQGRVTKITNIWTSEGEEPGEPSYITYTYSGNELSVLRSGNTTVYEIDEKNRIVKEFWNSEKTEYAGYEYNSDGFLVKAIEYYGGKEYKKWTVDVENGNVIRHTRYSTSDGSINRIKEFKFITSGAGNVNGLEQTSIIDSNWKVIGGFYGKASARLVSSLDYWNGPGDEANAKTTTISYPKFDEKGRITEMVRSGSGWSERFTYSYYED
jgi:hypothetical protein